METDSSLGFTSQKNQAYFVITSSIKDPNLKEINMKNNTWSLLLALDSHVHITYEWK